MLGNLYQILGLDAEQVGEGTFRFASPWPGLVTFFVIVGLVWAIFRLYRTEAGSASSRYRKVLAVLRLCAAFIVIFMLFRPILVLEKVEEKDAYVIVLLDNSLSMNLKDKYDDEQRFKNLSERLNASAAGPKEDVPPTGSPKVPDQMSRAEIVNRFLSRGGVTFFKKLQEIGKLRVYRFGQEIEPITLETADGSSKGEGSGGADAPQHVWIKPLGQMPRLGDAITTTVNELRGQQIAGLIIITDGQSNSGRMVEEAVEDSAVRRTYPFPIITVGVGSEVPPKDLEVFQVLANEAVFVNDEVVFSVLVKSKGFKGRTIPVQLTANDNVVSVVQMAIDSDDTSHLVKLRHIPPKIGQFKFRIVIPQQDSEIVTDNNQKEHLLRVVNDKVRVLYVSDLPGWEYRYLKNAMLRDHTVEVSCLLQSADPEFIQEGDRPIRRFPSNKEELYQFDVVVFTDANFSLLNETQIEALKGFVEDLGGGVLFAAGPHNGLNGVRGTPLENLLPVIAPSSGSGPPGPHTESFQLKLTPEGFQHPVLRMESGSEQNVKRWNELPGFFWYYPVKGSKSGALTLAVHPFEHDENGPHVILAAQIYGAGRSLFLASSSTWRWRYFSGDLYFYRFWGQSARFLSTGRLLGQNKRLSLLTDRSSYQLGDEVVVTARVLDEFYRPLELSVLNAQTRGPDSNETVVMKPLPRRPGTYLGIFRPKAAGQFQVEVSRPDDSSMASRSFMVQIPSLEHDHPEMNEALLRRIAKLSSGQFFLIEDISDVVGKITQIRESIVTEIEDDLWDSPLLLLLFAFLVITEWILRKRRMMI